MYTKDVIVTASPAIGNDVWGKSVTPINADSYNVAAPTGTYDVFGYRQWYHKVPPVAAGGDVSGTIVTAQGGQSTNATGALTFTGTVETGQGGQTSDITAALVFAAAIETAQGGQTSDLVVDNSSPTPPTPVSVRGDGGFVRRGNLVTYFRPKDLEPEIARARIVKKVAKRLKIKRIDAAQLVEWADQNLMAGFEFRPSRNLAISAQNADLQKAQIAQIKAYWAALETAALAQAEEDEEFLLWLQ